MRRSFGPMGGGGGGGGMMKTVHHRAMRAASGSLGSSQQPFSHNNTTYTPSSSGSDNKNTLSSSSVNHPAHDFLFSTVPSMDEVHDAISSLQLQVLNPTISSHDSGWDFDWIEPSTSMLKAHRGSESVYDAFRLLQTEPSVKRMVMSLSSDKSVWEAVMNNEAVRELRDSVYKANNSILGDEVESSDGPTPGPDVLKWILINTKAKLMEMVKKTTEMVNRLFQSARNEKAEDQEDAESEPFETKLKSSLFLTIMVLLIVVVTRSCKY